MDGSGNSTTRRALITGASSGIGAATARLMAAEGWELALVARREDRLEEVLKDCRVSSPHTRRWVADLSEPARAADLAEEIWGEMGPVDVLLNNAGAPMRRAVTRLSVTDVERITALNYFSPVAMMLRLLPCMIERGSGVIVNVSSLAGRLGIATEAAYCGSKYALAGFSESASADLEGTGVRVRLVLPGAIDTEIWDQPDNDAPVYKGPLLPVEGVARGIVDCIDSERFEHYLPDMKAVVEMKTSDIDSFFAGMRAMHAGAIDETSLGQSAGGDSSGGGGRR